MNGIFDHSAGKHIPKPTSITTTPEKVDQNDCGIEMKIVVAFKSSVKSITDSESDPMTTIALLDIPFEPSSLAPITTGKSGSMHGANTVNTPAKIEMMKKIIYFISDSRLLSLGLPLHFFIMFPSLST